MKKGIFVGLATLDIVYYQESIPLENYKSRTNNYRMIVGGPAANAAITYSILGGKSILITTIGDSDMGKMIKKELIEDYGVDIIDFAEDSLALPSIASIAVNVTNGSRTIWSGQQLVDKYAHKNIGEVIEASTFCMSDCNNFEISMKVLQEAKKNSKPIILDAGSWKENFEQYLSVADDAIASFVCKPPSEDLDFMKAAKRSGVENRAITNGEGSIEWESGGVEKGAFTPPKADAVDTLGAGDIFHGAYCYFKYEKELCFEEALKKASEVASLSVQYYGPRDGVKEYKDVHVVKQV